MIRPVSRPSSNRATSFPWISFGVGSGHRCPSNQGWSAYSSVELRSRSSRKRVLAAGHVRIPPRTVVNAPARGDGVCSPLRTHPTATRRVAGQPSRPTLRPGGGPWRCCRSDVRNCRDPLGYPDLRGSGWVVRASTHLLARIVDSDGQEAASWRLCAEMLAAATGIRVSAQRRLQFSVHDNCRRRPTRAEVRTDLASHRSQAKPDTAHPERIDFDPPPLAGRLRGAGALHDQAFDTSGSILDKPGVGLSLAAGVRGQLHRRLPHTGEFL